MSDNWLLFVPSDPIWQPSDEAAQKAAALLATFVGDAGIVTERTEHIEIVHPFANWDGVECPSCRTDVDEWFHDVGLKIWEGSSFTRLDCVLPCCGLPTSLNELHFIMRRRSDASSSRQ